MKESSIISDKQLYEAFSLDTSLPGKFVFTLSSYILDPLLLPERSYELGSVRPSVLQSFSPSILLSGSFLGIGSLVFSESLDGVRGPCGVVHDRARFLGINFFAPKRGKWAKNRVFAIYWKI